MTEIIPKKHLSVESDWQKELANAYTDPQKLLLDLGFDPLEYESDSLARKLFPMRVPRPFVARMQKGDINDPLLKQVLPLAREFDEAPGFTDDPLLEKGSAVPGLLHKYQSRVLLIVRGGCAINCRYCFRRHFPYGDNSVNQQGWKRALEYISQDDKINEVILSGGDPLMAKDDFLRWLVLEIEKIPHISRLRVHSRLPVVIPQRVTSEMLKWLTGTRLTPIMVLHINHSNELDEKLIRAIRRLKQHNVTMLNQAVLLAGINDSADAQVQLNEALFSSGVMPYYLHSLDKVKGSAHFEVEDDQARDIMAQVIKRLPGYLVPKLVREIGDQPGKTPIDLRLHP